MKDVKNKRQLREVGEACKKLRESIGKTQASVASELKLTPQSISLFECGKLDSIYILSWYVSRGLSIPGGAEIWQE